ncbi:MAG: AAA family ATPase [Desulfuromonadaceae bacterium]|nr:AAA family ATPase [Desulfuromonadaceae bacterium]MDD2848800.1 AAA family ATPase [Desulfuromonadaceae bacterium]MDD4130450.1 AAA family ATPase [Desulfuromonadaceae bacterium]
MDSTYLDFFGLREDPFRLTPDPAFYYPSSDHANALLSLDYIMNNREGFCLLTGEPGTGKSTLIRIFLNKWQEQAEIALVMTPRLSPEEFLQAILEDLGVVSPLSGNKNNMIKEFRDFLLSHAANDRRVAIVVDEAQNLPIETLEELRLLSNLETEKEKLLQIILIGQPELVDKLSAEQLKQLNQRISVRASLHPLSACNTADYLATRLRQAGANAGVFFDKDALETIHRRSNGIPRLINLIASRSLMAAYLQGCSAVKGHQVKIAAEEVLRLGRPNGGRRKKKSRYGLLTALLLVVTIIAAAIYYVTSTGLILL